MLMFADIAEGLLTENERLTRERDAAYAYEDELLRKVEAAEAANERLTRERDEALDNALQVRNWAEAANEPLRAALRAAAADSPAARAALAEGVDRFLGDTAA
jgi:hypothetical protein